MNTELEIKYYKHQLKISKRELRRENMGKSAIKKHSKLVRYYENLLLSMSDFRIDFEFYM